MGWRRTREPMRRHASDQTDRSTSWELGKRIDHEPRLVGGPFFEKTVVDSPDPLRTIKHTLKEAMVQIHII